MNCWIILLLLCCCGKNNGIMRTDMGCGCDCDDYDHNHAHNDGCGCAGDERVREKWMPYTEYNDNDRRDCGCK